MAKEEENQKQDNNEQNGIGLVKMLIIAFVLLISAIGGFFTGRIMGSDKTEDPNSQKVSAKENKETEEIKQKQEDKNKIDGDNWYYELDPVLANLNVPGATRYVRAVLTLEMSPELSQSKGEKLLEKKKPVLINWLTIYLSNLGLDDVKGEENLKRIQTMIQDVFNEKLWPDSKPKIEKVLIKEFPIQ